MMVKPTMVTMTRHLEVSFVDLGGLYGGCGPVGPLEPKGSLAPLFMNLYVKCLIFSAKDYEDSESHLLCNDDWMNSPGIVKDAKCGRLWLI